MQRKLKIVFVLMMIQLSINAQDIHFTQYNLSPLNLNPAQTGFFDGDYRFTLNNRTQWKAVTVPYRTMSVSADMPFKKNAFKQHMFGAGLLIYRDKAGDSEYGTIQANASLAWIKSINKKSNHFVSVALQPGIAQRTINYTKLMFDSQYDGNQYNQSASNNESFAKDNFVFLDLNMGAYWFYRYTKQIQFEGGMALSHLNTPKQSLFDDNNIRLDRKLVIHGSSTITINEKFDLLPSILFMCQGKYREFDIGSHLRYVKDASLLNYTAFSFGLWTRTKDAAIITATIDYHQFSFGISYDINSSNLKPASNARGGPEFAIKYILRKKGPVILRETPCPIL